MPPKQEIDAESRSLAKWRAAGDIVVVELVNGKELKGRITNIARFSLDLETEAGTLVVLKHAVAILRRAGD